MRDTKVIVKTCKEYSTSKIFSCLNESFELLGGLEKFIKPSHTVLIKPDLFLSTTPNEAKTTNPHIITALADLVDKIGAKCIIADSPKGNFKQSNLDNVYSKTQMLKSSNHGHASLNTNDSVSVINNPQGEHCRDIYVIDAVNDADVIINVGKFRCDKNLGLIGCAQNLFGLIPGKFKDIIKSRCYTLKSYYNYNIDLYEALENKVILNILDGIVANESNNYPRILNTILVGENPYAIDATALKIINQSPEQSLLLAECVRRNKLDFSFEILGDAIQPLICSDFCYPALGENIKRKSSLSFKRSYNRTQKRPVVPAKRCKACKICVNNCPVNAISIKSSTVGEYASVDYNKCINCFNCIQACPYKIIKTKTPIKYKRIHNKIDKALKKHNHDKV